MISSQEIAGQVGEVSTGSGSDRALPCRSRAWWSVETRSLPLPVLTVAWTLSTRHSDLIDQNFSSVLISIDSRITQQRKFAR